VFAGLLVQTVIAFGLIGSVLASTRDRCPTCGRRKRREPYRNRSGSKTQTVEES